MTNSKKLKAKIEESELTTTFIANELNLSRAGFYNKLNGLSDFFSEEIYKLGKILKLSDDEIIEIFLNKKLTK